MLAECLSKFFLKVWHGVLAPFVAVMLPIQFKAAKVGECNTFDGLALSPLVGQYQSQVQVGNSWSVVISDYTRDLARASRGRHAVASRRRGENDC